MSLAEATRHGNDLYQLRERVKAAVRQPFPVKDIGVRLMEGLALFILNYMFYG